MVEVAPSLCALCSRATHELSDPVHFPLCPCVAYRPSIVFSARCPRRIASLYLHSGVAAPESASAHHPGWEKADGGGGERAVGLQNATLLESVIYRCSDGDQEPSISGAYLTDLILPAAPWPLGGPPHQTLR